MTRWLHWAASLLLASAQLFRLSLCRRSKSSSGLTSAIWPGKFLSELRALALAQWVVALLSLMVLFVVTAREMTGSTGGPDFSPLAIVASQTQFGHVCVARLAILVLLGFCFFPLRGETTSARHRAWAAAAAILAMASALMLALTGHAAATPGPIGIVHLAADVLHLAAASVWPAGLVYFALFLRFCLRVRPAPLVTVAARATDRFSTASLLAVALLSATGLTIGFFMIHDPRDLWSTRYGRLLTAKILAFLVMLAFGAQNLLVLKRKLRQEAQPGSAGQPATAAAALLRNVVQEIVLGAAILLIVAMLGITEPPGMRP